MEPVSEERQDISIHISAGDDSMVVFIDDYIPKISIHISAGDDSAKLYK